MKKSDVIDFFGGNGAAAGRALGITKTSVYSWGKQVPEARAKKLEKITKGKLVYSPELYPKPLIKGKTQDYADKVIGAHEKTESIKETAELTGLTRGQVAYCLNKAQGGYKTHRVSCSSYSEKISQRAGDVFLQAVPSAKKAMKNPSANKQVYDVNGKKVIVATTGGETYSINEQGNKYTTYRFHAGKKEKADFLLLIIFSSPASNIVKHFVLIPWRHLVGRTTIGLSPPSKARKNLGKWGQFEVKERDIESHILGGNYCPDFPASNKEQLVKYLKVKKEIDAKTAALIIKSSRQTASAALKRGLKSGWLKRVRRGIYTLS